MKEIAKFYTIFWIIYFPTCIAYNDLPGFSVVDELLTVTLMGYTFSKKGMRIINNTPWKEYTTFLWILAFYVVYSLIIYTNDSNAVFLDVVQQIRPYSVIYCTWILNPRFNKRQLKWMLAVMIVTTISFIVYHPLKGYNMEGELVDAEYPVLGQLAICTGMSYYLFTEESNRNRYIALLLTCLGLFAPKMKFIGELVSFFGLLFFVKSHFKLKSMKTIVFGSLIVAAVLIVAWEKFDAYFVTGMDNENLARPMLYKNGLVLLWEYLPFGSGLGTFGTHAAYVYYSPLYYRFGMDKIWGFGPEYGGAFNCDAFYPTLAQVGIVGVALFVIFWKRRILAISKIMDMRYYRVAIMAFFCLAIESTADSSYLSGKGMGYFMILGLCMNVNRNIVQQRQKSQLKPSQVINETNSSS